MTSRRHCKLVAPLFVEVDYFFDCFDFSIILVASLQRAAQRHQHRRSHVTRPSAKMASSEQIVCLECSEKILHKNLKTHYLRHHPNMPVKYKSSTSKDIACFFPLKCSRPSSSTAGSSEDTRPLEEILPVAESAGNAPNTRTAVDLPTRESDKTSVSSVRTMLLQSMMNLVNNVLACPQQQPQVELQELQLLTVDTSDTCSNYAASSASTPSPTVTNLQLSTPSTTSSNSSSSMSQQLSLSTDVTLTNEEREDLIVSARSVDRLLKWADTFERHEAQCSEGIPQSKTPNKPHISNNLPDEMEKTKIKSSNKWKKIKALDCLSVIKEFVQQDF